MVVPSGMTSLVWPVTTPSGSTLTAIATATATGDSRADNNEARASTSVLRLIMKIEPPQEPQLRIQPK